MTRKEYLSYNYIKTVNMNVQWTQFPNLSGENNPWRTVMPLQSITHLNKISHLACEQFYKWLYNYQYIVVVWVSGTFNCRVLFFISGLRCFLNNHRIIILRCEKKQWSLKEFNPQGKFVRYSKKLILRKFFFLKISAFKKKNLHRMLSLCVCVCVRAHTHTHTHTHTKWEITNLEMENLMEIFITLTKYDTR